MRKLPLAIVLSAGVLMPAVSSWAAKSINNGNTPNNGVNNGTNNGTNDAAKKPKNYNYPPPVDTSPAAEDKKKVISARDAQAKAQMALNKVVDKLKAQFEASSERKATVAAAEQARSEYDGFRTPLIDSVHNSAVYKAAAAEKEQVNAKFIADDGSDHAQLAQERLDVGKKLTKLEADALAADPKVVAAQQKCADISGKLAAQYAQFQESIKSDSQWQTAKAALDKAKSDTDAAEKELTAETAREAQAIQDRNAQIAEIERQKLEHTGKR